MAGSSGSQIIGGKSYTPYTPEWYAVMNSQKVTDAGVSGTAEGTAEGNKISAESPALLGLFGALGDKFNSSMSSTSGGGGLPGGVPSAPAGITPVDTSASTNAAFATAKDQVGQETGGALTGLRSALAGRGLLGSGAESRGTTSVITKGQGQLGQTSRDQAVTTADLGQKSAETNYQGALTQRDQDIQREGQILQANQAQAQLQLQSRQAVLSGLMAALSGSIKSY